jgi:hypothetical protein
MSKLLSRKAAEAKLKTFAGPHEGILIYVPECGKFLSVFLGNGSNDDTLPDDTDAYLYLNSYSHDGIDFRDEDGGMMPYSESKAKYGRDVSKAVFDAVNFMYGTGTADLIPDIVPIKAFSGGAT